MVEIILVFLLQFIILEIVIPNYIQIIIIPKFRFRYSKQDFQPQIREYKLCIFILYFNDETCYKFILLCRLLGVIWR